LKVLYDEQLKVGSSRDKQNKLNFYADRKDLKIICKMLCVTYLVELFK